ncbi:MAG: hypothetical protein H9535_19345 [Ignavibacteria bacterium]|nr:hypothetical protein [Ignavibacteria bacterium]
MSSQADNAFVTQFTKEWVTRYQLKETKLLGTVRKYTGVGSTFSIPRINAVAAVRNKPRHADLAPANAEMDRISFQMQTVHAGDVIDNLDQLRTNAEYRGALTDVLVAGVNREIDRIITEALNTATTTEIAGTAYTPSTIITAGKLLSNALVPQDENRFAIISPGAWEDAISDNKIGSRDYINRDDFQSGMLRGALGFNHVMFQALPDSTWTGGAAPAIGASRRRCFFYHKESVAVGIGQEPKIEINYVPEKFGWFIGVEAMVGAVLVQPSAVFRVQIDD